MPTELPPPVRHMVLLCIMLETAALGAEVAGVGAGVRNAMIALGGFWPGLLDQMSPIFPGQSVAMFATSAVLHGNPVHLAMNMVGLLWLGPMVVDRLGPRGFWPLAGLSALGAGALYAAMATSNVPMVGASGILFGLLGAWAIWLIGDHLAEGRSLRPYLGHAVVLIGLNVALGVASRGTIAWEAHLGGFLAGAGCGLLTWRKTSRTA